MQRILNILFIMKKLYRKIWQTALYGFWKIYRFLFSQKRFPKTVNRILFMPIGGIGNVVLFTPIIAEIRKQFPQAAFTFIMRSRGGAEVIRGYPRSEVYEFDFKNMHNVRRFVRRHRLPRFDLAFNWETFYGAYLAFKCRTRFLVSFTYSFGITAQSDFLCARTCNVDHSKHEIEQNLDLVRVIMQDFTTDDLKPFVMYTGEQIEFASKQLEVFEGDSVLICMHLGSLPRMPEKRWPLERFAELVKRLIGSMDAHILILGSASERRIVNRFMEHIGSDANVLNLVGRTKLKQSAALIQRCDLFIGNDSGPMHIAAAVGTPVIGIFGPTNPVKNRPWGTYSDAVVVRHPLPCSPCYVAFSGNVDCTNPNRLECMTSIGVDEVFEAVKSMLER